MDQNSPTKETTLQELHACKAQLSHYKNLYSEALTLESEHASLDQKYKDLEIEHEQIIRANEKKEVQNKFLVEQLENECRRLSEELNELKLKLGVEPAPPPPCSCDTVISVLQVQVESLEKKLESLTAEKTEANVLYSELQRNYESTAGQLEEITSLYESKRDELESARQMIDGLTEEKVLLESELTLLKAPNPDLDKRGNSLFAEVEDKRKSITKNLETLQLKYNKLKQVHNQCQQELRNIKDKNLQLEREANSDTVRKIEARRIEAYQTRIADLEKMVAIYSKRPESPIIKTVDFPDLPMVSAMLQRARDEAESMRLEFLRKSQAQSEEATKAYMAERNLRLFQGSMQTKDKEIEKLQEQLEEKEKEISKLKEDLESGNKENGNPGSKSSRYKTVRFAPEFANQGEIDKPKLVKPPKCVGVPIFIADNVGPVFRVSNILVKKDKDALKKPE